MQNAVAWYAGSKIDHVTHFIILYHIDVLFGGNVQWKNRRVWQRVTWRWMSWCWEPRCSEIQSLTVRQIVPLATRCPFNFSTCWLIAKEHCLSQRESNLACLPGYSSAKAPYNEPVLSAPSSRLLWCSYLLSFSWLAIQRCTNTHPR